MEEVNLKKLKRTELLEMMISFSEEAESCRAELHEVIARLEAELKPLKRLRLKLLLFRTRWRYPRLLN